MWCLLFGTVKKFKLGIFCQVDPGELDSARFHL